MLMFVSFQVRNKQYLSFQKTVSYANTFLCTKEKKGDVKKLFTWQGGHLVVFQFCLFGWFGLVSCFVGFFQFFSKTMHSPNVQMIKPRKFIEVNLVVGFFSQTQIGLCSKTASTQLKIKSISLYNFFQQNHQLPKVLSEVNYSGDSVAS